MASALDKELEETKLAIKFWRSIIWGDRINMIVSAISLIAYLIYLGRELLWNWQTPASPPDIDKFVFWLLVAILVPSLSGSLRYFARYDETLKRFYEHSNVMVLLEKSMRIFQSLLNDHPRQLGLIKLILDRLPEDFGGVVIGANEKDYIDRLRDLVPATGSSFLATLRGGTPQPEYTIKWFFEDSMDGQSVILAQAEKEKYLQSVNDAPINKKVRLVLRDEKEMADFLSDDFRSRFFKLNSNVQVYQISPTTVIDNLVGHKVGGGGIKIEFRAETSFIWEDYAVFDECVVVKHNGKNTLYLGVKDQIKKLLLPFQLLDSQPHLFKKLDADGLYTYDRHSAVWHFDQKWSGWNGPENCEPQSKRKGRRTKRPTNDLEISAKV